MSRSPEPDRRRASRRSGRIKVRFWNDRTDRVGYTTDLSPTGLFLETRHALPPGSRLHLELFLPGRSFFVEAEVLRCVEAGPARKSVTKAGLALRVLDLAEALAGLEAR